MSADADRTHLSQPPAAPPRPTFPPRPGIPPRPSAPPPTAAPGARETAGSSPSQPHGASGRAAARGGGGNGRSGGAAEDSGDPTQEDEPTPQMPHQTDAQEHRSDPPRRTRGDRGRPPQPTVPPQPPPPTGQPVGRRGRRPGSSAANGADGAYAASAAPDTGRDVPPDLPAPADPATMGALLGLRPLGTSALEAGPETGDEDSGPPTARLRPVRDDRSGRPTNRMIAAAACMVLGVGLLGGAVAGTWLSTDVGAQAADGGYDHIRGLWHTVPVDDLFPRTLNGRGAGPGGADRRWTRVAVAPDSGCADAFDPLLAKALSPAGCARLVRATYADETTSSVTTVGMVFTRADEATMRSLRKRFAVENLTERTDLKPRAYPARGTVAADFGDAQRASWTVRVSSDAPVVVYAVSGFADGRTVSDPQSASQATEKGENSAAAQAGLGHDAQGVADRIERALREEPGAGQGDDE